VQRCCGQPFFIMAYLRTDKIPNGSTFSYVDYYTCDVTGEEIYEGDGWFGNDKIHISRNGFEVILEQWIEDLQRCAHSLVPMAIVYLEKRFTEKIKTDRYIPKKIRLEVLSKYKHQCVNCGSTDKLEIDHIHPVSKKGVSELYNLQVLCKKCNIKKSNKLIN
jgi:HNH endonuclease